MTDHNERPVWTPPMVVGFIAIILIWGSTWLVIKNQLGPVPPSWSIAYRFMIASAAAFILARIWGDSVRIDAAGLRLAATFGTLHFCGSFQFVYRAEEHLTSGVVAVLHALMMVPSAVMARAFLGQPLTRQFLAGSAITMAGIAFLLLHEARGASGSQTLLGVALTFSGMLCASTSNVLQATREARRHSPLALLAWALLAGTVADIVLALLVAGPPVFDGNPQYWFGTVYLAIAGSVVTYPIYSMLLRNLGPGRAAYTNVAIPVVAMLASTLFEGYRWSVLSAIGSIIVTMGLVVALSSRKPSRQEG